MSTADHMAIYCFDLSLEKSSGLFVQSAEKLEYLALINRKSTVS